MAKPSSWISHVEAFVDSSRPSNEQAASLDAIAALVKNGLLTLETLVREMELYLTTSDSFIRSRGILLLAEILTRLISKPLDSATIHSLVCFFTSKLADWQALHGALVGCLALLRRKDNVCVIVASDAKALAQSYLTNVQVQSLAVDDRKLCFEVLQCLLNVYPETIVTVGDDLVYGICEAIDEEKDPRCLMLTFHLVESLVQLFPDPVGTVASFAGDLFEILGRYFPIYFTHPRNDAFDIKRDDLSTALMHAFCSTPYFEPFAVPLLLDKLSSSLPLAKLDSLKYLNHSMLHYGADRMVKHSKAIWSSLKDAIFTFSPEGPLFSSTSESAGDMESQANQIAKEALICLQTAVSQLNAPNKFLFLNLIVEDEDIDNFFGSIIDERCCKNISTENQRKLTALGSILSIPSKVSTDCCSIVFQRFFPRLIESIGIPTSILSNGCFTNCNAFSNRLNFGALYLCVELLVSCRDLAASTQKFCPQFKSVQDSWWCLLQNFSAPLAYAFGSTLVRTGSSGIVIDNVEPEHVFYGVKGLRVLATFPISYSPISKDVYEEILVILMSVITGRSEDTFLWKLALKALVHIGSSIEQYHDLEKGISYNNIVVGRIISLLPLDASTVSLELKLEAISAIGTTGPDCMLRAIQGLEEAIFANLLDAFVEGNLKATEVLVHLLECYSNQVIPWCHRNGHFEDIAMRFAVSIWNQMENLSAFNIDFQRQGLLDTTMMTMKLVVGGCTAENQGSIVQKAYNILSSRASFSLESILSSSKLQELPVNPDYLTLTCKDEWLISLFASVLIALHPQTRLPDVRMIVKFLMVFLLKGLVPAAQALGSMINKWPEKFKTEVSGSCTLEDALEMIFEMGFSRALHNAPLRECNYMNSNDGSSSTLCLSNNSCLKIHAMVGLAWVGKGLLMRGHEKVKEIVMLLLECLLSSRNMEITHQFLVENGGGQDMYNLMKSSAADAFHVLLSDSEVCLNKKFHATVKPVYKQRFFSSMMPILLSSIKDCDSSSTRAVIYRAFGHVVSDTPLAALVTEANKVVPSLLDCLSVLSPDILNKDLMYSLLLVLSGILMDENGKEATVENVYTIISHLVRLISYPHMLLVRETAIQCLIAMSELPYTRIYPMRPEVLRAISMALDDRKRAVRQEAVRCRQAWASIASRSIHF